MIRTPDTCTSIITALSRQYNCLPLDNQAMAVMVDSATRYTGTQHRLTLSRTGLSRIIAGSQFTGKSVGMLLLPASR